MIQKLASSVPLPASGRMKIGKVYLVGAGPGHPDLLTIRAADLIRTADAIIYDRLVQEEVLALAKPSAEKIFMGKPLGKHASRQDQIHELLVRKAREGKTVVRLKGGDPFLFGRGGEEAEYLADRSVAFEVIPGVSSCLSAPLSAGIAVTHRDTASSLAIVTGHHADGCGDRLDWQALSKIDTLVILMGVHNIRHVAEKLMTAGRSADTPVAIIQMAFWGTERLVTATLETIADEVRRANIEPPATLVIGEAVRLHDKLNAFQEHFAQHGTRPLTSQPTPTLDQPPANGPELAGESFTTSERKSEEVLQ